MKNRPDSRQAKGDGKRPGKRIDAKEARRKSRPPASKHLRNRATDSAGKQPATAPEAQPPRLQKIMAAAGLGSRRALEQRIESGEVQLNGAAASLGQTVAIGDRLQWGEREWRVVAGSSQHRSLIYNKPEGEITSRSDPEGRPTVFDRLPRLKGARWVAIGRLDINTTGLLLLTTDGELANAMMHPSNRVDREYVCRIRGLVSDEQVEQLNNGVELEDGPAHFNDVRRMGGPDAAAWGKPDAAKSQSASGTNPARASANQWFQVTLLEGRNREVRRLWESLGHMVSRLKRVRYGAAMLPKGLKVGHWHEISAREHQVLREDVGLPPAAAELTLKPVVVAIPGGRADARPGHKSAGGATPESGWPGRKGGGRRTGRGKQTLRSADMEKSRRRSGKATVSKPGSPAGGGRRPGGKARRGKS